MAFLDAERHYTRCLKSTTTSHATKSAPHAPHFFFSIFFIFGQLLNCSSGELIITKKKKPLQNDKKKSLEVCFDFFGL
jgi:hypothetical protein